MTVFTLKVFAVFFMLIDHIAILLYKKGYIHYDGYFVLRVLGRFSFPIYAFLLAEGFRHLKKDPKRLRDHATLLLILLVISEPLFDRVIHGTSHYYTGQSVIFTLLIGFAGLWLADSRREKPLFRVLICVLCGFACSMIAADYRLAGIVLIFSCSAVLDRFDDWQFSKRLIAVFCVMFLYYLVLNWVGAGYDSPAAIWRHMRAMGLYGLPHLLVVPVLAAYNGRIGFRSQLLHRCYQWFYPVHLGLLCIAAAIL